MSDPRTPVPEEETAKSDAAREAKRKRRHALVFGDVLPDGTRDESPDSWGDRDGGTGDDEWFRNQVPPHHG